MASTIYWQFHKDFHQVLEDLLAVNDEYEALRTRVEEAERLAVEHGDDEEYATTFAADLSLKFTALVDELEKEVTSYRTATVYGGSLDTLLEYVENFARRAREVLDTTY